MKILIIADPLVPVPPTEYGGAERIVAHLCEELVRMGHRVDLMAGPGSKLSHGKLWIHRAPSRSLASRAFRKIRFQWLALLAAREADVIVNFGRLDYLHSLLRGGKPLLCCFQNPVQQSEIDWLMARRQDSLRLIGVSQSQIEGIQAKGLFSVVHNCTDTANTPFSEEIPAGSYLAFLGRLTANKGVDSAIRVARRCGIKLLIAGNISNEAGDREFFEREIRPQLDAEIEWIGPVNDDAKQKLLNGALALLFPIRWKEPCALVVPESLACGTPVIATRCASTPEVIDDGVTGFLCDSEDEMVAAVGKAAALKRSDCRRAAEKSFSVEALTRGYLHAIEKLVQDPPITGV
jgi:glycosyltransferase involved in cell wall biosynthesis